MPYDRFGNWVPSPPRIYRTYDIDFFYDHENESQITEYNHPLKSGELKKLDEQELVDMFNEISKVLKSKRYGGCKPEELHQSQLRIDTILHEKHDHDLNMDHEDDTDWKVKGKLTARDGSESRNGSHGSSEKMMIEDRSESASRSHSRGRKTSRSSRSGRG